LTAGPPDAHPTTERRITIRHRGRRIAGLLAAGFLLGTFAPAIERPPIVRPADTTMTAEPVALDADDAAVTRAGGLLFLDGWWLRSRDVRFGGLSAMHVADGRVTAVSDAGNLFRFAVPARGTSAAPLRIDRLAQGPGSGRRKGDRDAESMAVSGGSAWIAFEGGNAVWRYSTANWLAEAAARPETMRRWSSMQGPEAMLRLADGRFLVLAEGRVAADGTTPVLLFAGDPAEAATPAVALRYRPPEGYRPTDAALLPDGRILVLNRRFFWLEGVSAMLTVVEPAALRPGATLAGRELAALGGDLTVDNMEALSVTREGGRTIVWIASDDNLNPLIQRTLLLKFVLAE
jgi:hypothetical protein